MASEKYDLKNGFYLEGTTFDETEYYKNVTVQILMDSKTGQTSIAWIRQDDTEELTEEEFQEMLHDRGLA